MSTNRSNVLLQQPSSEQAQQYYQALLSNLATPAVEVRADAGGNRGKGLFATKDFSQGDIIFQERPLVGIQELHSKLDTSTCANCFTAVGTVEQAFGGKICCLINELSEATEDDDLKEIQDKVDKIQAAVDSKRLEGLLSGKVQLPLTDRVDICTTPVRCRGGCDDEYCSQDCEQYAWEHHHCLLCPGPAQQQHACSSSSSSGSRGKSSGAGSSSSSSSKSAGKGAETVHGAHVNRAKLAKFLEHADDTNDIFRVAAQVIASTIITADKILQEAAADAAEDSEAAAAYSRAISAAAAGQRASQRVLAAAGPAAATASKQQLEAAVPDAAAEQQVAAAAYEAAASAAASSSSSKQQVLAPATAADAASILPGQQGDQQQPSKAQCLAALAAAFLPFSLSHKAPWWQVAQAAEEAAAADDSSSDRGSDDGSSDESMDPAELAAQLRELAAESLALLRSGLQDDRFPELFDLELYGSLVGMFELNNLALTVPAPVGRYKALLLDPTAHGVHKVEAAAALPEVKPLLDALGDEADGPAEGTGFFSLQSTINHSCAPNAAADCLPSGQVVITALQDIPAGSEVLLSYIEEEGADLCERRCMLRDYGFSCACQRCEAEQLAGALQQQQL